MSVMDSPAREFMLARDRQQDIVKTWHLRYTVYLPNCAIYVHLIYHTTCRKNKKERKKTTLAPSVHGLQLLVNICDCELKSLDMAINARKSSCMRFGPGHKSCCADVSVSGFLISWTTSSRYLGVYLESSVKFKCSFAKNKAGFYKAFNSILEKLDATLQRKFSLHWLNQNVYQFCSMALKHVQ